MSKGRHYLVHSAKPKSIQSLPLSQKHCNRKALRLIFWFCVVFNALAFLTVIASYPPVWYTNDDYRMMTIVSGAYTGTPSADIIFMRYPIGILLSGLYSLTTSVPWYGLFTMLCMYLSCCIISHYIIKKAHLKKHTALGVILYAVLFIFFIRKYICLPQFTLTSAFLCVAAAVVIFELPSQRNILPVILAVFCCVMSFSVRSMAFYMLLPMIAVIVITRLINEKTKVLFRSFGIIALSVAILCAGVLAVDIWSFNRGEEYMEYDRFNSARSDVYDYGTIPSYNHNIDYYIENEINETTYRALAARYLDVDERLTAESLESVSRLMSDARKSSAPLGDRILLACEDAVGAWMDSGDALVKYGTLVVFLGLAVTIIIAVKNKQQNIIFPLTVAGFVLESIYLSFTGRIMVRVVDSFLLAAGVVGILTALELTSVRTFSYREKISTLFESKSKVIVTSLSAVAIVALAFAVTQSASTELKMKYNSVAVTQNSRLNALKDYAETQPDVFFFYESSDFISSTDFVFRTYKEGEVLNHDSLGSWNNLSPTYYERNALFGFTSSGAGLTSDDAEVRFVAVNEPKMGITEPLKDIYNKKLKLVDTVDSKNYILYIYSVVDDD